MRICGTRTVAHVRHTRCVPRGQVAVERRGPTKHCTHIRTPTTAPYAHRTHAHPLSQATSTADRLVPVRCCRCERATMPSKTTEAPRRVRVRIRCARTSRHDRHTRCVPRGQVAIERRGAIKHCTHTHTDDITIRAPPPYALAQSSNKHRRLTSAIEMLPMRARQCQARQLERAKESTRAHMVCTYC